MASVDKMVQSGRITDQEAARLRAAGSPEQVDAVVGEISMRHARMKIGAAVDTGSMPKEDADGFLDRMRRGEHPQDLRAQLRGLRS